MTSRKKLNQSSMALSTEQKERLRNLIGPLIQIEEAKKESEGNLGDLRNEVYGRMDGMARMISDHKADVAKHLDTVRSEHKKWFDGLEKKMSDAMGKMESSLKDRGEFSKKEMDRMRTGMDQLQEMIKGEIRAVYSKLGGGTMPQHLQKEDAVFVPDGTTVTYYFYNKPSYIVVGGATLVEGDGYATPVSQTDGWDVTFDDPPAVGQTPHSWHY
jgi:hypothetical protein